MYFSKKENLILLQPHEDENMVLDITIKDSNNSIAKVHNITKFVYYITSFYTYSNSYIYLTFKVAESKMVEPAGNDAEIVFDTSTPHSSLRRPMSSPLKRKIISSFSIFG